LEREQRKLAAIVAVDVAGYSRLMGLDEEGTLRALRGHRTELVDQALAEHGGRIANTAGDSMLIEFPSAVGAVRCMFVIQDGMVVRNAAVPKDRQVCFRIGVNVGDVIAYGDDLLGDGVNVAARLEGECLPGGVCIADDTYRQVKGRVEFEAKFLGELRLKNIADPVRAWQWLPRSHSQAVEEVSRPGASGQKRAEQPSIAILPFDNMSSDPEHEFFAEGIAEDIITALSKISQMRVIARNSTFAYKGKAMDLRNVAEELGVRYVVEGSVRSGGKRLRITAQLIDATDGSHIWAERFDRTIDDLFDIQDEITKEIVSALQVNLTDGETAFVMARGTNDIEAWQLCVRATELILRLNTSDYLEARTLAERAIKLDPNYAYAWATLGFTWWWDGRLGYTGDAESKFLRADEYAQKAMALDSSVSWVIGLRTMVAAPLGRYDEAVEEARRGVALYPSNADIRCFLGVSLSHATQYEEAIQHLRAAMASNPFYPTWYLNSYSISLRALGRLDEALEIADEVIEREPTHLQSRLTRAFVYQQQGQLPQARAAVLEIQRIAPNFRVQHLHGLLMLRDQAEIERVADSLRAAGLPD
jgi:TolB-like protein/Tfp pilus assembly protein PilF